MPPRKPEMTLPMPMAPTTMPGLWLVLVKSETTCARVGVGLGSGLGSGSGSGEGGGFGPACAVMSDSMEPTQQRSAPWSRVGLRLGLG